VKEQPGHIDQRELARILREQWGLAPGRLCHLPVGFGDHHWELTGDAGGRWFITVAELAGGWRGTSPAAGYADLRASMETVTALRRAGLEFAVAPVPTAGGQALAPLGDGNAVTVFPYVEGASRDFGDGLPGRDRLALIGILARLHDATPLARRTALARSPSPASRPALEAALGELSESWSGGPYSEPARQLLARHAARLGRALARLDELARAAASNGTAVITHGEPHPGNIMRSGGRLLLIDWTPSAWRCPSVTCGWRPVTTPARPDATPSSPGAGSAAPPWTSTGCAGAWMTSRSSSVISGPRTSRTRTPR
jgi:spectinomycin phosphotransferase